MSRPIHVIYIPGFGNKFDTFRSWILDRWKYKGITMQLVPMNWESGAFDAKLRSLNQAIDAAKGKRIVLIGESAGGSMVVHSMADRPKDLFKVVTLCGKNSQPETVGQSYFDRSPAFKQSMQKLNQSIEQLSAKQCAEFVSIHPIYDPTVPVRETLLPGCRRVRLWVVGHQFTILLALTLYSPIVIRTLRRT